ncbi:hypothetical protein Psta_1876 [Pirellula staleyi DSM 6068]|uniref:Uncharacterized protein n=1 Tax=Pirellula staleyi (strain ATCC 27377 / DSM 6068 / ICPB 4128) TaxID=530564 RepID=D2QZR7_PIRSD|nr:hypothetical protein Psta_1876 [Pirellula staleyi DSM 6068]
MRMASVCCTSHAPPAAREEHGTRASRLAWHPDFTLARGQWHPMKSWHAASHREDSGTWSTLFGAEHPGKTLLGPELEALGPTLAAICRLGYDKGSVSKAWCWSGNHRFRWFSSPVVARPSSRPLSRVFAAARNLPEACDLKFSRKVNDGRRSVSALSLWHR